MQIQTYSQAQKFLFNHIPHGTSKEFPGEVGLTRMKRLMQLLGDPQEKLKVIHIAGTSGKGSTAVILSRLLTAHGYKTGLHISPHILDIRERVQINNTMLSKKMFTQYVAALAPIVEIASKSSLGKVTYFELMVALAFYSFYEQGAEYAVIETGMGGLLDGTNVVKNTNKVCIITKIGLDHTEILGNTLPKIAAQKAGIIHEKNLVISTWQNPSALKVLQNAAGKKHATFLPLSKSSISHVQLTKNGTLFDFIFKDTRYKKLRTSLHGIFQAENISVALSSFILIAEQKEFEVKEKEVRAALLHLRIPARMDILLKNDKTFIIDGAHNPQKMEQFLLSLTSMHPNKKFVFVIAFKKGKSFEDMLRLLVPIAKRIIFAKFSTSTYDLSHLSQDPKELVSVSKKLGLQNATTVENAAEAITISTKEDDLIVATGSLYFASDVYKALSSYSSQHGSL